MKKTMNFRWKRLHHAVGFRLMVASVALAGLTGAKLSTPACAQAPVQEFRVGGLIENGFLGDPKGWTLTNFGVDKGLWIHRKGEGGYAGTASTPFLGPDGFYKIRVKYWDEGDGVSTAWVTVGGRQLGKWSFDGILVDAFRWKEFDGVEIKKGEEIVLSGGAGGYEYCRIAGMEILPSKPLPAPPAATAIEKKEYSMNLVPVSSRAGAAGGLPYVVAPTAAARGGAGTHWIYLKAGQEFQLSAEPGFAGHAASLQYSLTKVGEEKPVAQETLVSEEAQPVMVRLRAAAEGLYELKVAPAGEQTQSGIRVDYDVPGVTSPGSSEGYFFVPRGTEMFRVTTSGHAVILDAQRNVMLDEWFDNETPHVIVVPKGSDNQIWYFQGPTKDFLGIPPYVAGQRDYMLAPVEVLK